MSAFPHDMNDFNSSIAKAYEDTNAFVSGYVSATAKANAAALQGFEDMTRNVTGFMQDSMMRALNACQSMMSARSPQEAADTHAEYMKDCFDNMVASSSKISEISLHTAKGAIDPLTEHANETMGAAMRKAQKA